MEQYNFDTVIDRQNTNSLKYDFAVERGKPADVLPLWVADMDFPAPRPVLEALHRAVDHGIFGYSDVKSDYYDAVARWFSRRFGWQTRQTWLVKTPGVVYALAMAVRALTRPGDAVLIQPPVYYPFFSVIGDNGRTVVENELVYRNGRYSVDFEDFERKIVERQVKLFLLCSPHNPVGRVWSLEELRRIGGICKKYNIYVISDEIHCDFSFEEHPHHVFLEANPELAEQAIVCTAPSKTFNLAGLQVSNIWIPSGQIREAFLKEIDRSGYSQLNTLGLVACQAAYASGGEWLGQCRAYLRENLDYLRAYLGENIPEIRLVEPEGTYFAWLDCSGLGLSRRGLDDLIVNRAKLWLDAGHIFGGNGGQFQRVVLACPRATLEQALERLKLAAEALRKERGAVNGHEI
ncbi:MAG: pyridoxal phosphate-dependent aminotransferase [Oscillospiraceae bacterium]|nr:pyridoxal phosphate-dependent aminotransferase [Oscillospiraceae bacterium]MBQ8835711.1 pyridoxal phosphate-dependent aminotransferase [Oscillospiraceae bacterium]